MKSNEVVEVTKIVTNLTLLDKTWIHQFNLFKVRVM